MSGRSQIPDVRSEITGRSGLTLIEVLVAVAILGMGIAGIVMAGSKCLAVARQARNYQAAREAVARVELKYPIQLEEDIEDAKRSGTLERPYEEYSFTRDVKKVGLEEDGLYEVTTEIRWSLGGKASSETVVTYVRRTDNDLPGTAVP